MYPEWTRNTYPVVLTSTAKSDFALYYLFRLAFILHCTRDNRSRVTLNRCILSTPVLLGGIPFGAFQLSPSSFRVFASPALDVLHISVVNTRCAATSRIARRSRSSVVRLARSACGSRVGSVVPRGCAYLLGSQGNSSHEAPPRHLGQDDRRLPIGRVFMRWLSGVIP